MDWKIFLSSQADKFLERRHLSDEFAIEPIRRAIRKLRGETVTINLKRLTGKWTGYYRVRVGKIRVIFSVDFEERTVFIEVVDNRGSVYQ
jgi:mRNA interferase RelE/StbE